MVENGIRENSVAIAMRYTLHRQALARLLEESGFECVAEADAPESLLKAAERAQPKTVLMEWGLGNGIDKLLEKLASLRPRPVIVLLAPPDAHGQLQPALRAGANGYLSLNIDAGELVAALRMLTRGGVIVSGELASALAGNEPAQPAGADSHGLSQREREVLELVATGATNREIAQALVVTEHTVKVHLRNVLEKLNLRNRQQAAAFAVREGIVELTAGESSPHVEAA